MGLAGQPLEGKAQLTLLALHALHVLHEEQDQALFSTSGCCSLSPALSPPGHSPEAWLNHAAFALLAY
jgi:hypothetical protein